MRKSACNGKSDKLENSRRKGSNKNQKKVAESQFQICCISNQLPPYPFKAKFHVFEKKESDRKKTRAYTANARMEIYDKGRTFMTQLIPENVNYLKFKNAKSKKNLEEKSQPSLSQLKDSRLIDFGYKNTPFFALMEQELLKCQKVKDECRLLVKREGALKSRPKTTDHSIVL